MQEREVEEEMERRRWRRGQWSWAITRAGAERSMVPDREETKREGKKVIV